LVQYVLYSWFIFLYMIYALPRVDKPEVVLIKQIVINKLNSLTVFSKAECCQRETTYIKILLIES